MSRATKTAKPTERRFAVALSGRRVGILHTKEDYSWFVLDSDYADDPHRAILGLRFEQDRRARHAANMRLPPWFSNLLPEGALRDWIATQRGVPIAREIELLAEVGHDLPGAVTVSPTDEVSATATERELASTPRGSSGTAWRFSLAGVQMKFSMLRLGQRFSAPAVGADGDWIVKLPDPHFPQVPRNEFAMMELARRVGIEVPDTMLVHRDQIESIPDRLWPPNEHEAYAVRRFDRQPGGLRIHMEDFAQVRGFYPEEKYRGTLETVANLVYRGHDSASLEELVRRLALNVLIRNADAHLKNWSLLYRDPRIPVLSPAYDLVSTAVYQGVDRDLGLRLCGTRRFERVTLETFRGLQMKLGVSAAPFGELAASVVERALAAWPDIEPLLEGTDLAPPIAMTLNASAASLRR